MSRPEQQQTSPAERPAERRRAPRQTLVAKAIIGADAHPGPVATGFISNISALGVGFHTRRELPVGGNFMMRLELGPLKWWTRLRVVSCQLHGTGTWDVGAEFVGAEPAAPAASAIAA